VAPGLAGSSDIGFVVGISAVCTKYGFRQEPWAFRQSLLVGYATLPGGGVADYLVQYRPTESQTVWSLRATGVSAQFTQFFGYGNGTSVDVRDPISNQVNPRSLDFFQVRESRAALYPAVTIPLADHLTWTVGPQLRYWDADHTPGTTNYIAMTQPYGVGAFGTISGLTSLRYDTRDAVALPTRGLLIDVTGRGVPGIWSADSEGAYGSVRGQATTYLTSDAVPLTPTLALRAGGMKVWGNAPFQDMAHVGSRGGIDDPFTVRGFYPDRFTGDAAVWGTAQLSAVLFHPKILLPSNVGLFLSNDVGRVFYPGVGGVSSGTWHDGYGGGFFVSTLHNAFSFSAGAAHSSEWTLFYFGVGTGL
jgi:outer membrane protein assembly factor BamA